LLAVTHSKNSARYAAIWASQSAMGMQDLGGSDDRSLRSIDVLDYETSAACFASISHEACERLQHGCSTPDKVMVPSAILKPA